MTRLNRKNGELPTPFLLSACLPARIELLESSKFRAHVINLVLVGVDVDRSSDLLQKGQGFFHTA